MDFRFMAIGKQKLRNYAAKTVKLPISVTG